MVSHTFLFLASQVHRYLFSNKFFAHPLVDRPTLKPSYSYKTHFGSRGTGEGQFVGPYAAVIDSEGHIFVADSCMSPFPQFPVHSFPLISQLQDSSIHR